MTATTIATTAAVRGGVIDDTLPFLSSSDEEEEPDVDAIADAVESDVDVIPTPRKRVAQTDSDSKRSHSRASSADFLEVLQASIPQDEAAREQDRLNRREDQKAMMNASTASAGGLAKAFVNWTRD